MSRHIRVEIKGRDEFWKKAVFVEWEDQFPERKLRVEPGGNYIIEADWLDDLKRIAGECFSEVIPAPADPGRRLWFRRFIPHG